MQGFTFSSLFLAMDSTTTIIAAVIAVVLGVAGCIVGWYIGAKRTKNNFEKEKGTLEEQKRKILEQAEEQSRAMKKEAILLNNL